MWWLWGWPDGIVALASGVCGVKKFTFEQEELNPTSFCLLRMSVGVSVRVSVHLSICVQILVSLKALAGVLSHIQWQLWF